jgi:hypothetical protein
VVTRATGKLPIPKSADEFEDIAADALRLRYPGRSLSRFGRSGQAQHGIDGFDQAQPDLVWQCTLQEAGVLGKLQEDLLAMDAQFSEVGVFVACLGFERDTKLQTELRKLSAERQLADKGHIEALFWGDLTDALANDPTLFAKHFPQHAPSAALDALAKAALEDREEARTPRLHLAFGGQAQTTGTEYEQHGFTIHNVGKCAVLLKRVELHWRVDVPGAATNRSEILFAEKLIRPEGSAAAKARVNYKAAAEQCEISGLPRPEAIGHAPIVGRLMVEAESVPYGTFCQCSLPYERPHPKVPPRFARVVEVRRNIMLTAYKVYMESPTGWWIFMGREAYPGELEDIAREARWLAARGWIDAHYSGDSSSTEVQLTTAGRDLVERDDDMLRHISR